MIQIDPFCIQGLCHSPIKNSLQHVVSGLYVIWKFLVVSTPSAYSCFTNTNQLSIASGLLQ